MFTHSLFSLRMVESGMITCPRNWANLLSVAIVMILTIASGCQKEESPPTTNSTTTSTEEISAEDTSTESSSSKADAANLDEKSGETSSAIPASSQGIHHILSLLPDFELTCHFDLDSWPEHKH